MIIINNCSKFNKFNLLFNGLVKISWIMIHSNNLTITVEYNLKLVDDLNSLFVKNKNSKN